VVVHRRYGGTNCLRLQGRRVSQAADHYYLQLPHFTHLPEGGPCSQLGPQMLKISGFIFEVMPLDQRMKTFADDEELRED
jgi:hypothetical protein